MKRIYILVAGLFTLANGYGQVTKKEIPAISAPIEKATTYTTDRAVSGGIGVAAAGETIAPVGFTAATAGPVVIDPITTPGHEHCPTHDLSKEYWEAAGMSWEEQLANRDAGIAASKGWGDMKTPGTNTIAVIFHVVHDAGDALGTGTNVSNAAIMNVFNDLVEDYSLTNADASDARGAFGFTPHNPEINFCLATQEPDGTPLVETGIIRVPTTEDWYDSDGGEENKMKSSTLPATGSDIWDRNKYLNVWICDISNGAASGTAGYAYKPTATILPSSSIDGIVLDYNLGVNNDNVLTHEVGHYLGLSHTWGAGGCVADDGFADTPNTFGPSFNQPAASCSGFQEYCPSIQTQYENYMDYSNCTVMFTEEQADYMMMILTTLRSSLMLSTGCDPTNTPPNSAFSSVPLGPSPIIIPEGGAVNFIDESTNVPTAWSWSISGTEGSDWDWSAGSSSTDENPTATFYNAGFYDVTLTASNVWGSDPTPADSVGFVQVVVPAIGTQCDTVRDYNPATEGLSAYIISGLFSSPWEDWGYFPGHGAYDPSSAPNNYDTYDKWAEKYTYAGTAEVRRLRLPIFIADDVTGGGEIRYSVCLDDAGGTEPGTELVEDTIAIADLFSGYWNELDFSNPSSVTGNFWIVFDLDYGPGPLPIDPATQDTVLFGCVNFANRDATTGINDLYVFNGGAWVQGTDLYPGYETSLYMDVLLSNGPDPVADFTFSDSEICAGGEIAVNGSISENVTDYFWNQWNPSGPSSISTSTDPAPTFTFASAGSYQIYLFGDGSCKTSGVVLPVTVNPPVTFSVSLTHTTCGFNNGIIDVTSASGGDGTYEYSLDGTTWGADPTFDNLPAGDYTIYVRTDGDACESQLSVTINSSAEFNATISPNSSICPGDNIDITVFDGVSWEWYAGVTLLGTTATINVAPASTEIYNCIVTNASGCESNVSVTITVDPLDDASFNFYDFCFGSANGAVDIATPGGVFSFYDDPTASATINASTGEIGAETIYTTYIIQYDVDDNCANWDTVSVYVNDVDDPSFVTDDFCDGDINVVSGVATPGGTFTYDITDASSIDAGTGVITGGVVGTTYTITYDTPAGICSASSSVAITVLPNPVISAATTTDPLCAGEATGEIDITVTGAVATSYDWGAAGATEDLTGLVAGTYDVTVYADVCSTTGSYTLTDPAVLVIDSVVTTNVLCNGDTDGTAATFASGGTPSFTYDYGGADENNLGAGVYSVTVTDGNGCTETTSFTINEPSAITGTATTTMDDGTSNGTIDLTPSGGTAPYTFLWDTGATTEDLTDLAAGDYEVTITDANGCTQVITFTVGSSVGIDDEPIENGLFIYPNPSSGVFTLRLDGEYHFDITDARGRLIMQDHGMDKSLIDLSTNERGVYMIRIYKDGDSTVRRLVLK